MVGLWRKYFFVTVVGCEVGVLTFKVRDTCVSRHPRKDFRDNLTFPINISG